MSSKNISIRKDVYDHLKHFQKEEESFSEEIMRLTAHYRNDFSDLIGMKIEVDWEDIERDRVKSREDSSREEILA